MSEHRSPSRRASGVLLHPTCLPGPDGIGDLGESAYRWLDWLEWTGQSIWQVLPLGPTSYGDSPYQTLSAFAGNPLLISLDRLVRDGWLSGEDLASRPRFDSERVDFGRVIDWKIPLLGKAWTCFKAQASDRPRQEFTRWCEDQASWLDDYALFTVLKEEHAGKAWPDWKPDLAGRDPGALAAVSSRLPEEMARVRFIQWQFFLQWQQLKAFAAARGIRMIGDVPIFVAYDSCDVWAHRGLFRLDEDARPTHVAGVPPDYFSDTGQLWGNPLYDWDQLAAQDYHWWVGRLRNALELVDIVRLDHFRGFEAYWEVPAQAKTAAEGRWVKGPGAGFFNVLREQLGGLPLIAEDLGVITPAVEDLRDSFDLPGMKVLQFAWSGPENPFLPHEYRRNCVVYSGTHDNDPTLGWWEHRTDQTLRDLVTEYVGFPITEPNWVMIRLGMMSVAHTFIATMQDVLGLGREGRMNLPGQEDGNWNWRMPENAFLDPAGERLARLTWLSRRRPDQDPVGQQESPA